MNNLPYCKIIDQSDFENPELLPFLEEVSRGERAKFGIDDPIIVPDSKQWECAMMVRALSDLGVLRPGALMAGIGAGTEETTFVLASRGCVAFPIDRYLEITPWSDVAPAGMMVRPDQFSDLDCSSGAIIPIHGDARYLRLPSNFFDGIYSAGSIEHFGSVAAVQAAAEEMGRILKPGGVAVLSTEFRLEGPNDKRWFSPDCILFTPELLQKHIVGPSGLELVGSPSWNISERTYDSRVVLVDFLERAKNVRTLEDKRRAYPNLVLYHDGFLFCSVHIALRKQSNQMGEPQRRYAERFETTVSSDSIRTLRVLSEQIADWSRERTKDNSLTERLVAYESQIASLQAHAAAQAQTYDARLDESRAVENLREELRRAVENYRNHINWLENSRSMRITQPLRSIAQVIRKTPILGSAARWTARSARKLTKGA